MPFPSMTSRCLVVVFFLITVSCHLMMGVHAAAFATYLSLMGSKPNRGVLINQKLTTDPPATTCVNPSAGLPNIDDATAYQVCQRVADFIPAQPSLLQTQLRAFGKALGGGVPGYRVEFTPFSTARVYDYSKQCPVLPPASFDPNPVANVYPTMTIAKNCSCQTVAGVLNSYSCYAAGNELVVDCDAAPDTPSWEYAFVPYNTAISPYIGAVLTRPSSSAPWGGVCKDQFTYVEANIACKLLGLYDYSRVVPPQTSPSAPVLAFPPSFYSVLGTMTNLSGPYYLSNISCTGTELGFTDCPQYVYSSGNTTPRHDTKMCGDSTRATYGPAGLLKHPFGGSVYKNPTGIIGIDCRTEIPPPTSSWEYTWEVKPGDPVFIGRMRMRPNSSAPWGDYCIGTPDNLKVAAVHCNMANLLPPNIRSAPDKTYRPNYVTQTSVWHYMTELSCPFLTAPSQAQSMKLADCFSIFHQNGAACPPISDINFFNCLPFWKYKLIGFESTTPYRGLLLSVPNTVDPIPFGYVCQTDPVQAKALAMMVCRMLGYQSNPVNARAYQVNRTAPYETTIPYAAPLNGTNAEAVRIRDMLASFMGDPVGSWGSLTSTPPIYMSNVVPPNVNYATDPYTRPVDQDAKYNYNASVPPAPSTDAACPTVLFIDCDAQEWTRRNYFIVSTGHNQRYEGFVAATMSHAANTGWGTLANTFAGVNYQATVTNAAKATCRSLGWPTWAISTLAYGTGGYNQDPVVYYASTGVLSQIDCSTTPDAPALDYCEGPTHPSRTDPTASFLTSWNSDRGNYYAMDHYWDYYIDCFPQWAWGIVPQGWDPMANGTMASDGWAAGVGGQGTSVPKNVTDEWQYYRDDVFDGFVIGGMVRGKPLGIPPDPARWPLDTNSSASDGSYPWGGVCAMKPVGGFDDLQAAAAACTSVKLTSSKPETRMWVWPGYPTPQGSIRTERERTLMGYVGNYGAKSSDVSLTEGTWYKVDSDPIRGLCDGSSLWHVSCYPTATWGYRINLPVLALSEYDAPAFFTSPWVPPPVCGVLNPALRVPFPLSYRTYPFVRINTSLPWYLVCPQYPIAPMSAWVGGQLVTLPASKNMTEVHINSETAVELCRRGGIPDAFGSFWFSTVNNSLVQTVTKLANGYCWYDRGTSQPRTCHFGSPANPLCNGTEAVQCFPSAFNWTVRHTGQVFNSSVATATPTVPGRGEVFPTFTNVIGTEKAGFAALPRAICADATTLNFDNGFILCNYHRNQFNQNQTLRRLNPARVRLQDAVPAGSTVYIPANFFSGYGSFPYVTLTRYCNGSTATKGSYEHFFQTFVFNMVSSCPGGKVLRLVCYMPTVTPSFSLGVSRTVTVRKTFSSTPSIGTPSRTETPPPTKTLDVTRSVTVKITATISKRTLSATGSLPLTGSVSSTVSSSQTATWSLPLTATASVMPTMTQSAVFSHSRSVSPSVSISVSKGTASVSYSTSETVSAVKFLVSHHDVLQQNIRRTFNVNGTLALRTINVTLIGDFVDLIGAARPRPDLMDPAVAAPPVINDDVPFTFMGAPASAALALSARAWIFDNFDLVATRATSYGFSAFRSTILVPTVVTSVYKEGFTFTFPVIPNFFTPTDENVTVRISGNVFRIKRPRLVMQNWLSLITPVRLPFSITLVERSRAVAIVSMLGAGGAAAAQSARGVALLRVADCKLDFGSPLDSTAYPIGLPLTQEKIRYYIGAMWLNPALLIGILTLHAGIGALLNLRKRLFGTEWYCGSGWAFCGFPSVSFMPVMFLVQDSMTAATVALYRGDAWWVRWVGGGLTMAAAWWVLTIAVATKMSKQFEAEYRIVLGSAGAEWEARRNAADLERGTRDPDWARRQTWSQRLRTIFYGGDEWEDGKGHRGFVRRFSSLFATYRHGREWFISVELGTSLLIGMIVAFSPDSGDCFWISFGIMMVLIVAFVLLIASRPYITVYDMSFAVVTYALLCGASVFVVVGSRVDMLFPLAVQVAPMLVIGVMWLGIAKSIIDVSLAVYDFGFLADSAERDGGDDDAAASTQKVAEKSKALLQAPVARSEEMSTLARSAPAPSTKPLIDVESLSDSTPNSTVTSEALKVGPMPPAPKPLKPSLGVTLRGRGSAVPNRVVAEGKVNPLSQAVVPTNQVASTVTSASPPPPVPSPPARLTQQNLTLISGGNGGIGSVHRHTRRPPANRQRGTWKGTLLSDDDL